MGHGRTIRVAAGQVVARLMNEASETLLAIERLIEQAAAVETQLLVLPECAYPAYLLGSVASYRDGGHMSGEKFVAWLAERARKYRLHIISGFIDDHGETLRNGAVFLDDRGCELGRCAKRFLWHIDHDWFDSGEELRAFDSKLGRIGLVICAETRIPEIVATLAADGAELIALPTCWINGTRDPARFENPQVEFLIEARAREFNLPFVCADKSGFEVTLGYVGQSRIVRADGSVMVTAPPTGEVLIQGEVELSTPRPTPLSSAQREHLLRANGTPTSEQQTEISPSGGEIKSAPFALATLPGQRTHHLSDEQLQAIIDAMVAQRVHVLLMPTDSDAAERLAALANRWDIRVIAGGGVPHLLMLESAQAGLMEGAEVLTFASARVGALTGADIILVTNAPLDRAILRARAVENRVFVAAAGEDFAMIVAPDGRVLADVQPDQSLPAIAIIEPTQARDKTVAPRTDIFQERRPSLYRL